MITEKLNQSFRLEKEDRIIQWSIIREGGFIRPFISENWLRILLVVTAYSILIFIFGGTFHEQLGKTLEFAVGFPLILTAFYFAIWSVRDREWRKSLKHAFQEVESGPRPRE